MVIFRIFFADCNPIFDNEESCSEIFPLSVVFPHQLFNILPKNSMFEHSYSMISPPFYVFILRKLVIQIVMYFSLTWLFLCRSSQSFFRSFIKDLKVPNAGFLLT